MQTLPTCKVLVIPVSTLRHSTAFALSKGDVLEAEGAANSDG